MIDDKKQFFSKSVAPEQVICEHWRKYVQNHDPEEVIAEFQGLFIEGRCDNRFIQEPLEKIITAHDAESKYIYTCSSSFYIIVRFWLKKKLDSKYIWRLLKLFDSQKLTNRHYLRHKKQIGSLLQHFLESKYPENFARIAIAYHTPVGIKIDDDLEFKSLLCRYPYLYQQLLLVEKDFPEIVKFVEQLKAFRNRKFESNLVQHFIYRSRLVEIAKAEQLSSGAGKILRKVANPTLLSHRDLHLIVKKYIKNIDDHGTLYDLSQRFIFENKDKITFLHFKLNLIEYLAYGIIPRNSDYSLSSQLEDILKGLYYQSDDLKINESLILLTCRKLYQKIIIKGSTSKEHQTLLELTTNIGTAQTAMLLIKIALICPSARVDLEARLANLFVSYESRIVKKNLWLVKLLEHCQVTISLYFGEMDIPQNTIF